MVQTQDGNVFVDLSGPSATTSENPYDGLIDDCKNDRRQIQERYSKHRLLRNEQQKAKLLAPDFPGFNIDPVLEKLLKPEQNPGYVDPRNCLVFWGRPPPRIREFVANLQQRLLVVAPSLWIMPPDNLHLTILEMAHSKTPAEITSMLNQMRPMIPAICEPKILQDRVRLVKPLLSYDGAAIALSFLPAAGERFPTLADVSTYHHLRRDLYNMCSKTGVEVASRYVVPSAHLTIARFVDQSLLHEKKIPALIETIEAINKDLETLPYVSPMSAQWIIGEEKSLDCRIMTVWYGGGESAYVSKGLPDMSEDFGGKGPPPDIWHDRR